MTTKNNIKQVCLEKYVKKVRYKSKIFVFVTRMKTICMMISIIAKKVRDIFQIDMISIFFHV